MISSLFALLVVLLPSLLLALEFWGVPFLTLFTTVIAVLHLLMGIKLIRLWYRAEFYFVSVLALVFLAVLNGSSLFPLVVVTGIALVGGGILYKSPADQRWLTFKLNWLEILVVLIGVLAALAGAQMQLDLNFWLVLGVVIVTAVLLVMAVSSEKSN